MQPVQPDINACREFAAGVFCVETGTGLGRSNVYLVRSGSSWALIDTGWADCGGLIRGSAESLFGEDIPPAAILLTHSHSDHSGSARELAEVWDRRIYVHPAELPLAAGDFATVKEYANPLDRWVIVPLLRLMPPRAARAMLLRGSFIDVAGELDPSAAVPGLPDWECVPTPGHTPGHVAFYRREDRVLITGDALLTVDTHSPWELLLNRQRLSGPPWYTTWDWRAAQESIASLAALEPRVLAGGHGIPVAGAHIADELRAYAAASAKRSGRPRVSIDTPPAPRNGRKRPR